jgi:20S proteasome alpha/beta subunit
MEATITLYPPDGSIELTKVTRHTVNENGTLTIGLSENDAVVYGDEIVTNVPFLVKKKM